MATFVQNPVPTYSQATMLTFTAPASGVLFFFYNTDHNGDLYSMDTAQNFYFVATNSTSECACEIVENWECALSTALKNGFMTPTQYQEAITKGISVRDVNGTISVGPNFADVISLTVSPTIQAFLVPYPGSDEVQLVYTLLPTNADQRVVWTTTDASVCTVTQQGVIRAIASGTATITVISVADPTKTATCAVTVV